MADQDGVDFKQETIGRKPFFPRAVGSPLQRGGSHSPASAPPAPPKMDQQSKPLAPLPSGRALSNGNHSAEEADTTSGMHRAVNAFRSAMPFVQRLLPLLDGNFASALINVFAQHASKPAPPPVNLVPLQENVADLQLQHRELHDQVVEQNLSIKKMEDQLNMVREATDRNTLEQQELMEDLKSVGHKVNIIAFIALGLLAVSILLNLVLYLHIQRVLP